MSEPSTSASSSSTKPKIIKRSPKNANSLEPVAHIAARDSATHSATDRKKILHKQYWLATANLITQDMIEAFGYSYSDNRGKTIAQCGHEAVSGELHRVCHKCQVFSRFPPCCTNLSQLCDVGKSMPHASTMKRCDMIKRWKIMKNLDQYPDNKITKYYPLGHYKDETSSTVDANDDQDMYVDPYGNNEPQQEPPNWKPPTGEEIIGQVLQNGDVKPPPTSINVPSFLPRGSAKDYQAAVGELEDIGKPTVKILNDEDGNEQKGLPLDTRVIDMINTRLEELKKHWMQPDTDIDMIPNTIVMTMNVAPYEGKDSPLPIRPLQFPPVETKGVRPAPFIPESTVTMTHMDLGFIEQLLKYGLYALTYSKKLTEGASEVEREYIAKVRRNIVEERDFNDGFEDGANPDASKKKHKRKSTNTASTTTTDGCTDAEGYSYAMEEVDNALDQSMRDANTALAVALVNVVVARRRSIIAPRAARKEKVALLTRPITNTFHLM